MKNILALLLMLNILLSVAQQQTTVTQGERMTYQILEDEPESANTNFIAPEFGAESNSTDLSIFLGANARKAFVGNLTFEGLARFDVYSMNAGSASFQIEAGGFLPLITKEKNKEVPIMLSYNPYAGKQYNTDDGKLYNVEETKYIKVPSGKYKNKYGIRGGLHFRSTGVADDIANLDPGNINLGGLYIGGQMTSQAFVKALINDDVERIGAGFTRLYADILVLPVSTVSDDMLLDAEDLKSDGILGWRVGYQWYISPHEGEYKFFGNSVFGAEIGSRPLSGFMFNFTWGYALNRS